MTIPCCSSASFCAAVGFCFRLDVPDADSVAEAADFAPFLVLEGRFAVEDEAGCLSLLFSNCKRRARSCWISLSLDCLACLRLDRVLVVVVVVGVVGVTVVCCGVFAEC